MSLFAANASVAQKSAGKHENPRPLPQKSVFSVRPQCHRRLRPAVRLELPRNVVFLHEPGAGTAFYVQQCHHQNSGALEKMNARLLETRALSQQVRLGCFRGLGSLRSTFLNGQLQHHHLGTCEAGVDNAFVRNVEHFVNTIDLARMESLESLKVDYIEPLKIFLSSVGYGVLTLLSNLQKTVEVQQVQQMDRTVDVTVGFQQQVLCRRTVQKTVDVSTVPVEVIDV